MIVRGESTIIDYHAPFDQGLTLVKSVTVKNPLHHGHAVLDRHSAVTGRCSKQLLVNYQLPIPDDITIIGKIVYNKDI